MMSQNVAITASTEARPNQPKAIATPAPAAGSSENSVTMFGVMRSAARKSIDRIDHPVDHLHRPLAEEHAAAVGVGARMAAPPHDRAAEQVDAEQRRGRT